jgi:hypothetical protein
MKSQYVSKPLALQSYTLTLTLLRTRKEGGGKGEDGLMDTQWLSNYYIIVQMWVIYQV